MTDFRRYRIDGGTYFFTVNLADRNRTLLTERIDTLREAFQVVKESHPFKIDAIVILPDHLHTIWTLPNGDYNFSQRWRQIKSAFPEKLQKKSEFPVVVFTNMSAEYGNGDFGSMQSVMRRTLIYM